MVRKLPLLVALLGLLAGQGCLLKTYTLQPGEAQRVSEVLRVRAQDLADEPIVADAVDEEGTTVHIELYADDELLVQSAGRAALEVEGLQAATALEGEAQISLRKSDHGMVLLGGGLALWAAGWAIVGAGMARVIGAMDWGCSAESGGCEHVSDGEIAAYLIPGHGLHAAGLGLAIAGMVYGLSREVDPGHDQEGVQVDVAPLVTGDGVFGGMLTARF